MRSSFSAGSRSVSRNSAPQIGMARSPCAGTPPRPSMCSRTSTSGKAPPLRALIFREVRRLPFQRLGRGTRALPVTAMAGRTIRQEHLSAAVGRCGWERIGGGRPLCHSAFHADGHDECQHAKQQPAVSRRAPFGAREPLRARQSPASPADARALTARWPHAQIARSCAGAGFSPRAQAGQSH
jgi:hypothetical protein